MTDNNHTITPPPELVEQWECEYHHMTYGPDLSMFISEKAARWGADRELQFCLDWFHEFYKDETWVHKDLKTFMEARRPKPPSLKVQALEAAQRFYANGHDGCNEDEVKDDFDIICRALESLPS